MQDVQQLLDDLMHRQAQHQQQAGLIAGPAAVPAVSTNAPTGAPKDEEDVSRAATAVRLDAASAAQRTLQQAQPVQQAQQQTVVQVVPSHSPHPSHTPATSDAQPRAFSSSMQAWVRQTVVTAAPHAASRPPSVAPAMIAARATMPNGQATAAAAKLAGGPPVSVPLLSSAIAAMLAGSVPPGQQPDSLAHGGSSSAHSSAHALKQGQAPPPAAAAAAANPNQELSEHVAWLQQQLATQAHEQQRQLSYVQSMHQWAGQIATSLRALQRQSRAAAATASSAQEEAAAAKASLVQLATLQDNSMQQVCQLSLEVAELKEQLQLVLSETGGGSGGGGAANSGRTSGGGSASKRRLAPEPASTTPPQQHDPELQPSSPKRLKPQPRLATVNSTAGDAAFAAAASLELTLAALPGAEQLAAVASFAQRQVA
jgi:hypothetical protein